MPIFTHVDNNIDEHDIDQPLSLTNKRFLEESSDQEFLPAILEEEPIFSDESNNAERVSLQTTDEILPRNNGDDLPPIFSQTQTGINDSYEGSDDEENPISIISDVPQCDTIARQLNNLFDCFVVTRSCGVRITSHVCSGVSCLMNVPGNINVNVYGQQRAG